MKFWIGLLCWSLLALPAWGQNVEPLLKPTERPDPRMMTLTQGQILCSVGLQTGGVIMSMDQQVFGRNDFQGLKNPRAIFGCRLYGAYLGYGFFDDAYRLPQAVQYQINSYTMVDLHQESLQVGYGVPLWPHRLTLDLGLSFYQLETSLGRVASGTVSAVDLVKDRGVAYWVHPVWYLHPFFFVDWTYQENINPNTRYQKGQWAGVHYWMRF